MGLNLFIRMCLKILILVNDDKNQRDFEEVWKMEGCDQFPIFPIFLNPQQR